MNQQWESIDCWNCAGTGIVRYGHKCVGSELIPEYCDECDGLGVLHRRATYPTKVKTTYPIDDESELDRKFRAYTSVGEMSAEEFRRLIDGRWNAPRKGVRVIERDGEILTLSNTPFAEAEWTNGQDPSNLIGASIELADWKNRQMFEIDEQDARPTETPYEKYARYMKEHNGVDMDSYSRRPRKQSIPGQVGSIILQVGKVARAFIREKFL